MRVSNKMIADRVLYNLTQSTNRFLRLQTQASSGRRINKPSDDPLGITSDLYYRSRLSDISQFKSNLSHCQSWLSFSDQALNNINGLIIEAKDVAIELGNDTYDENARLAGAAQIGEIFNQLMDAANSQYQNKYIFSGSKTGMPAIFANSIGAIYQGDYQDMLLEIERGSYLKINSFGNEFLTAPVAVLGEGFDLNPGIQPNMWLTDLNAGQGVNMGAGQFIVNTLNGTYTIDPGAANVKNIQQLLDTVNAAAIPNFIASIHGAGSGIQFEDTTAHHLVAVDAVNSTPLSMLNNGSGVSQAPGTFVIRNYDSSIVANIDISADTNVFEVLTTINAELDAQFGVGVVSVSIDPEENRLVVTDTVAGRDLYIEESGTGQTTAAELGIAGVFQGTLVGEDLEPLHIQVQESAFGETLAADLGILHGVEYETLISDDLNPRLTYYSKISSLNSNAGIELGVIRISNGLDCVDIDLSPLASNPSSTILDLIEMINLAGIDASAYLNSDSTGIIVKSKHDDRTFMITEADNGRTASALGIFGSTDLIGNMMILKKALERNNVEEIGATLNVYNKALDQLLTSRSSIGSRAIRAETAEISMMTQELLVTGQLSEIEDADMIRVISDLAMAEIVYQSALASAARMIQPSLLDFLR